MGLLNIIGNALIAGGESRTSTLNDVLFGCSRNQRVGTPVSITSLVPSSIDVIDYCWEIFDSFTGVRKELSFQKNPTFDIAVVGFYDIKLTVTTAIDSIPITKRFAFKVHPARFTIGEADLVIDFDSNPNQDIFSSHTGQDRTGYKIAIKGTSSAGHKIEFFNLKSTTINNPVRIQAFGDCGVVGNSSVAHTWWLSGDCDNIVIDGYKEDGTRGLSITNTAATGQTQLTFHTGRFTGIQYYGTIFNHNVAIDGAALSIVGRTATDANSSNWEAANMAVYDNILNNCGEEGMYLNTNHDAAIGGFIPYQWYQPVVAHNTVNGSGRDCIQVGGCIGIEMWNNFLYNWGQQMDSGGQTNAISWNGGTAGVCAGNIASGGKVLLNIQSGLRPWRQNTGETVPRHNYFLYNVMWNGSYSGWSGGDVEPVAVYIQNELNSGNAGPWNNYVMHNTLPCDKKGIEQYFHLNSFSSDENTCANNIFVVASASAITTEYNFTGTLTLANAATTADITLVGNQTIDGVVNPGVVLVKNQAVQTQNGLYVTGAGAWTRHTSADSNGEIEYLQVKIAAGTTNINTLWHQTTPTPTLGVSNIVFANRNTNQIVNNLVRLVGAEADIKFRNYVSPNDATPNLTLLDFTSVAYGGSPIDTAARIAELAGKFNDQVGYPLLAPAQAYTFGAYSGYNKRLVVFTPVDGTAATFTSAVAVGTLTQSGGTITYEANKVGLLQYVITTSNTAPTKPQIKAGKDHTGANALLAGTIYDFGTAASKVVNTLNEATSYYLHCYFKTVDLVEQVAVTTVNFTTAADVTAPILSGFAISDTNRDRITFNSDSIITGTTVTGFTVATPTKTVTGIVINAGQLTGHYWTVNTPFEHGDVPTLAYAGGSNVQDTANTPNALANFGATAITNNIIPGAYTDTIWDTPTNATVSGNDITGTGASARDRSTQKIPVNSNGNIAFFWNTISRAAAAASCGYGMVDKDVTVSALVQADLVHKVHLLSGNNNVDNYQGSTYKTTTSGIQSNGDDDGPTNLVIRCHINRADNLTRLYYGITPDNIAVPTSWTLMHVRDATVVVDDLRAGFFGASGFGLKQCKIQADKGLT